MKLISALVVLIAIISTVSAGKRRRCFPVDDPPNELQCGRNEQYEKCSTLCIESSCAIPFDVYCESCKERCLCEEGYIRDSEFNCIKEETCPPAPTNCTKPNEHYEDCGSTCPLTCRTKDLDIAGCPEPCVRGCYCDEGFARDDEGDCISPEECPVACIKANEYYSTCGPCPLTCDNMDNPPPCPKICRKGCFCKPGYVRNARGDCIRPRQCPLQPMCEKPHEVYSDCFYCPRECKYLNNPPPCLPICNQGCVCEGDYVRNDNGDCVLPSQCPDEQICPKPHESYSDCGPCEKSCDNPNPVCIAACQSGCFCDPGYVRNAQGECVRPRQCPEQPVCEKPHQIFSLCGPCEQACDNLEPTCPDFCQVGCFCEPGYVRDFNGKCIREHECPANAFRCKGAFEVYQECGTACPRTCKNKDEIAIACTKQCVSGCFCREGYVRDESGECVLSTQCPESCTASFEHYSSCNCEGTCANPSIDDDYCKQTCTKGCFCNGGYVRNGFGDCVLPEECTPQEPSCTGENEFYSRCGTCEKSCDNMDPICPYICQPGCECKPGYVRDPNGKCIFPEQCFATPRCMNPFEMYDNCGTACPKTCENKDDDIACIELCVRGCFCRKGYVRDARGRCVREEDCPAPVCYGKHEMYVARTTICAEATCTEEERHCGVGPASGKCHCKKGYVRGEHGECIPRYQCD